MSNSPYQELESRFERLSKINEAAGILQWDMACNMPSGGAEARAGQLSALKVLSHEGLADPALADFLDAAGADQTLDPWQQANLEAMRRRRARAVAVDADLVRRLSEAGSACEMLWREAKAESDFAMIQPSLAELRDLVAERASALAAALNLDPYDALLDGYEPDGRAAKIAPVFDDLAAFLPGFIDDVLARQAKAGPLLDLPGPFALDVQRRLCRSMMEVVGFDFDHGRLDESHHPFCGGVPEDIRITTRYSEDNFMPGLMGVLHETGHALYEQGLPARWRHQPVGKARGMALHESQSLMIEMQACRSAEFITFAAPRMKEAFGGEGPAWDAANILRHYNKVERGFIRVDADEVTYPAHVILRFRLERAMLAGDLAVADLPGAWNDGMQELLAITPPDDARGCLQDIHWYDGAWGYFPTYTLGAMAAAQLFAAARAAHPDIPDGLARGDFTRLLGWLRENVHGKASSLTTDKLLAEATGSPLQADAFKAHLQSRYLA
ncbi:MAG TPA: carboxypeptidase M32 [Alphaproteobacteria bacterium]|nr:carboxypeptidase M32 [Alphaproteobacteria bacterium]